MPLVFAGLITTFFSVLFIYLENKTKFSTWNKFAKQLICGVAFGLSAVFATELGSVEVNGAAMNIRDAAPVTAGLLFGPWAGIIAGLIGAIDRYFIATPIFGVGAYTQVACSVATLFAGCIAALFKATVFRRRRPYIVHAFIFILITELVHVSLVPLTHFGDIENAVSVMYDVFFMLLGANAVCILVVFSVSHVFEEKLKGANYINIIKNSRYLLGSDLMVTFQFAILGIVIVAFSVTIILVSYLFDLNTRFTASQNFSSDLISLKDISVKQAETNGLDKTEVAKTICTEWTEGDNALYFMIDNNDIVVSENCLTDNFNTDSNSNSSETLYEVSYKGQKYYTMYTNFGNYRIVMALPEKYEMFYPHLISMVAVFLLVIIFGLVMLFLFMLIRRLVSDNLKKIDKSLEQLSRGDFDVTVDVRSSDIFSSMSDKINATVGSLKENIDKEANKYNADFETAKDIQLSLLPRTFPAFPNNPEIDIYARYRSAKKVGGDLYDYYLLNESKLCFLVADVSGKGIPAAMFMTRTKLALMQAAKETKNPAHTLFQANNYLAHDNSAYMFVTVWIGILDLETGHMVHSSAGHDSPIIYNTKTGKAKVIDCSQSFVLAGNTEEEYFNSEYDFQEGEILVQCTDGVKEANNKKGEFFGEEKFIQLIEKAGKDGVKAICDLTVESVDSYADGEEQFDDITILALKYNGKHSQNN